MKNYCGLSRDGWLAAFLSIFIGVCGFFAVVGPRTLYPDNLAWLSQGDPATHYLGWVFFRDSVWTFPLGLNPMYGLEIGNAIVFSDSNPLFAILFKPFSGYLPDVFQYFGIWILSCFVFQALFAYKLINLVTKSAALCALGAAFHVFAPPMLWRLHGHLSLVGHFLVVASLYLALAPFIKNRIFAWTVLLVVSGMTHAYFLAMVGLIWIADLANRYITNTLFFRKTIAEFTVVVGATFLACWQAGYFSVDQGLVSAGYGLYRMHPLSVLDPSGWSYILGDIPEAPGVYEGFNYLGSGMIFLAVCALPGAFKGRMGIVRSAVKKPFLLAALISLTVFALSNRIGIKSTWFEIQLLDFITHLANVFQSSGRFFWPVFYAICFVIICVVIRSYSERVAITLLGLGLLLQIVDTSAGWLDIRAKLMTAQSSVWQTKMVSPFWSEAADKYSKVRWLPPGNHTPEWRDVANYAGMHRLGTDAVYLARVDWIALETALQKSSKILLTGQFEPDTLYLLEESRVAEAAMSLNAESDLLAKIDGFNVVAPGWKKCTSCLSVSEEVNPFSYFPEPVEAGRRLVFARNHSGLKYLGGGWSPPEDWGTWSEGKDATIFLPLYTHQARLILVEANPLLNSSHPEQTIEVSVNDVFAGKLTLTADSGGRFEIEIPSGVQEGLRQSPVLKLRFRFPDAARPVDLGINNDSRELAIGLTALTVR